MNENEEWKKCKIIKNFFFDDLGIIEFLSLLKSFKK